MSKKEFCPKRVQELGAYALKKGATVLACIVTDLDAALNTIPDMAVISYQLSEELIDQFVSEGKTEILFALSSENHTKCVEYQQANVRQMLRRVYWVNLAWRYGVTSFLLLSGLLLGLFLGGN